MLLKSVSINNFRGFKNLEIKDLKPVSLLIGKNNCGKTSVLEALLLLAGCDEPGLSAVVQSMRQMRINSDSDFKYLFNDFNISNTINISAETTNIKKMRLEISPLIGPSEINNSFNNEDKENFPRLSVPGVRENVMKGIHYKFTGISGKSSSNDFSITSKITPNYGIPEIFVDYINTGNMLSMATAVGDLIKNKAKNEVLDVLKDVSDIIDIAMGANNTVYVDIRDKKELQPINIAGDGIIKIISILARLRQAKNGILLIDEIENGLYYSSSSLMLWKAIFKACQLYNVQIVATTHSDECIKSFYTAYKDEKLSDGISMVRIDKKDDEHRAVYYNEINIETAIEHEIEVR
jgi:AAA15 family ATPase/GTPase